MTMAICLKCGGKKLGALTPCAVCRFEPVESIDQAKSLLLSDHYMAPSELDGASEKLKSGEPMAFGDVSVRELADAMKIMTPTHILGVGRTSWIILGIAIAIGTAFGACLVTIFRLLDP